MPFDTETLADKTMEMLAVSRGQVIWIWASDYSLEFIQALAYRLRERGAFWNVRLICEPLLQRIGLHAPEDSLAIIPEHELRWLADVSAIVDVRDHSSYIPNVPMSRRRAMAAEWIALIDEANRRGCRRIAVLNPTLALAQAYGIELEQLQRLYQQAIGIDHTALEDQQARLSAILAQGDAVHITSSLGTDLRLRIGQRPVLQDKDNLPRGEVFVAPHEDSANGVAVIDRLFIKGQIAERVRLTFTDGKVTRLEAPNPHHVEVFEELLAASSGDKDVIAEFAIGLNPGITEPIGNALFDEKIGGSVHIAIGMNANFGGRNQANLHMDMVMLRPTVRLDGTLLLEEGVLRLGDSNFPPDKTL